MVGRNHVLTYQIVWSTPVAGDAESGRGAPAESEKQPGPTSPPGGSSTGKGTDSG